jgi:hypothetical protein
MKRPLVLIALLALPGCGRDEQPATTAPGDSESVIDTAVEDTVFGEVSTGRPLGSACTVDGDCASGLSCWTEKTGRDEWPKRGICTMPCTTDGECDDKTKGSLCVSSNRKPPQQKFCYPGCTAGGATLDKPTMMLDPAKCGGRADLGCQYAAADRQYCFPTCSGDEGCGSGKCDPYWGLCAKGITEDMYKDIGNGYAPDSGVEVGTVECSTRFLMTDPDGVRFCSASCTVGVVPSCGWNGMGKANAACLSLPPGGGVGDRARCVELCDCDSNCRAPLRCVKLKPSLATEFGRVGFCAGSGESYAASCGDAG